MKIENLSDVYNALERRYKMPSVANQLKYLSRTVSSKSRNNILSAWAIEETSDPTKIEAQLRGLENFGDIKVKQFYGQKRTFEVLNLEEAENVIRQRINNLFLVDDPTMEYALIAIFRAKLHRSRSKKCAVYFLHKENKPNKNDFSVWGFRFSVQRHNGVLSKLSSRQRPPHYKVNVRMYETKITALNPKYGNGKRKTITKK